MSSDSTSSKVLMFQLVLFGESSQERQHINNMMLSKENGIIFSYCPTCKKRTTHGTDLCINELLMN